jgi:hypothetical protein
MCQGLVPKLWKEGNITALFKKGDKTEPGNYRPVSLTSVICKTMEKLVRETIVKHMSTNKQQAVWLHLWEINNATTPLLLNGVINKDVYKGKLTCSVYMS